MGMLVVLLVVVVLAEILVQLEKLQMVAVALQDFMLLEVQTLHGKQLVIDEEALGNYNKEQLWQILQ
jgi:hypothetical protein